MTPRERRTKTEKTIRESDRIRAAIDAFRGKKGWRERGDGSFTTFFLMSRLIYWPAYKRWNWRGERMQGNLFEWMKAEATPVAERIIDAG